MEVECSQTLGKGWSCEHPREFLLCVSCHWSLSSDYLCSSPQPTWQVGHGHPTGPTLHVPGLSTKTNVALGVREMLLTQVAMRDHLIGLF